MTENTKIHFLKNYPPLPPLPPLTLTFILKTVIALFTAYALVIKMQSMHVCLQLSLLSKYFLYHFLFIIFCPVLLFRYLLPFLLSNIFFLFLLLLIISFFLFCQSFCLSFPLCSSRLRYILSNRLPLHLPFLIHFSFLCFSIFLFPHPLSSFYINFLFSPFFFLFVILFPLLTLYLPFPFFLFLSHSF